jgi:hypothetical protein
MTYPAAHRTQTHPRPQPAQYRFGSAAAQAPTVALTLPRSAPPPVELPGVAAQHRPHDKDAAGLRHQVVQRVWKLNAQHAHHAWNGLQRMSIGGPRRPISPHAVAFFYAQPSEGEDRTPLLRTATRLFLAGPQTADPVRVLTDLTGIAAGWVERGGLDPRRHMADRSEPTTGAAWFAGVALSTLDTDAGPWEQVSQRAWVPMDLAGRVFVWLTDHTMILLDRRTHADSRPMGIRATHSIDSVPGHVVLPWSWNPDLARLDDPVTAPTWRALIHLGTVIWRGHRVTR